MAVNRGIGSLAGADRAALELLSENNYRTAIGNALTGSTTPQNNRRISIPATPTVDPLSELFSESKKTYQQLLGDSEDQKKQTQAQMLFDIANTALAFSMAGSRPGMSPAERLAEASVETQLFPKIGARTQAVQDQKQKLNVAALQSAETQRAAQAAARSAFTQRLLEQATDVQTVAPGSALFMGGEKIGEQAPLPKDRFLALSRDQVLVEPGVSNEPVAQGFQTPLILSEGQSAVTPTGEPIASGPEKPITVKDGERVIKSDGTEIYVAPGEKTILKEGDVLVNSNNEVVARGQPKTQVVSEGQTLLTITANESGVNVDSQFTSEKSYTLSEGQQVVRNGEVIAQGKDKRIVLKPGDTVFGPDNQIIAEIDSEYTLGEGQIRMRGNTVIGRGRTPTAILAEGTRLVDEENGMIIAEGDGKKVTIPQGSALIDTDTNMVIYRNPPKPLPKKMMNIVTTNPNNGLETTQVVDINTTRGQKALDIANELARQGLARIRTVPAEDVAENTFFIPSLGKVVTSYNQGRTYIDADGVEKPTPGDRQLISPEKSYDIYKGERISQRARQNLNRIDSESATRIQIPLGDGRTRAPTQEEIATYKSGTTQVLNGTGLWANLVAFGDNLIGGAGIAPDTMAAFSRETQDARQFLQYIRIAGRSALAASPRFAVADLQATEGLFPDERKFFANPPTQARKLIHLSEALKDEYIRLNTMLAEGIQDPTLKSTALQKVSEIEKLNTIIGPILRAQTVSGNEAAQRVMDRINKNAVPSEQ